MSIKIQGGYKPCIELHSSPDCGSDRYVILRPGYPKLNSLIHYGMHESDNVGTHSSKAVSLCGKFCNATNAATINSTSPAREMDYSFTYMEQNDYDDVSIRWGRLFHSNDRGWVVRCVKGNSNFETFFLIAASFNVTRCVTLAPYMYKSLYWMKSNRGKCINIYPNSNCRGRVVRWKPLSATEYDFRSILRNGDIAKLLYSQVKSFAPCKDKCDPKYWEGFNGTEAVDVTLFNSYGFAGKNNFCL